MSWPWRPWRRLDRPDVAFQLIDDALHMLRHGPRLQRAEQVLERRVDVRGLPEIEHPDTPKTSPGGILASAGRGGECYGAAGSAG